jgi:hypothetical protein
MWWWWLLLALVLLAVGAILIFVVFWSDIKGSYGTDDDTTDEATESTTERVYMPDALASVPTILNANQENPTVLEIGQRVTKRALTHDAINTLMEFACYWDVDTDNACPDNITQALKDGTIRVYPGAETATGIYPYWYSDFSLLGIIHFAQAYSNTAYSHTGITIDPTSVQYVATENFDGTELSGDSRADQYIIPTTLYNRYQKGEEDDLGFHFLYHKGDGTKFAALPYAKFKTSQKSTRNTGGAQSYVSLKEGTTHVYAINRVINYTTDEGFRTIILFNTETRTFLVHDGSKDQRVLMVGKGGFNVEDKTWYEGEYYVRVWDNEVLAFEGCINSKTQKVVGNTPQDCSDERVRDFFLLNELDVSSFLGLSSTETTDLKEWLSFFADANPLPDTEIPKGGTDAAAFPDEVQYTETYL